MNTFSSLTASALNQLSTLVRRKEAIIKEVEHLENQIASVITGKKIVRDKVRTAAKVGKVKKGGKRSSGRGLGAKVLSSLEAAGDAGVKVTELAEKLRVKGTNLHVWFSTTGRKNPAIKKVGKGHYRLQKK